MDWGRICQELVRALRGRRSAAALSRRMRFRSNTVAAWEKGRNHPTASQLLALAARTGVNLEQALGGFYRVVPEWLLEAKDLSDPKSVARFLSDLRGALSTAELSRATGLSRFALTRIYNGEARPKGPVFLLLIQACSRRVLDFVARLTSVEALPSLAVLWRQQQARRFAATRSPWALAVLCALELDEYRALPEHVPGFIAKRLGLELELESECLSMLEQCGQVRLHEGRYEPTGIEAVELSEDRELARTRRAFWGHVGAERARQSHGMSAYNLCGVSHHDLQRLKVLQREYLARARAIIADSQPVEAVALIQVHVLELSRADSASGEPEPLGEGGPDGG